MVFHSDITCTHNAASRGKFGAQRKICPAPRFLWRKPGWLCMLKIHYFSLIIESDKVRLMSAATDIQQGSSMAGRRRIIEPVNKLERHADSTFKSNSRMSLELEFSKEESL